MKVIVDSKLLGERMLRAASAAGWEQGDSPNDDRTLFLNGNAAPGASVRIHAFPGTADSLVAVCEGAVFPEIARISFESLLDGHQERSLCPTGSILAAGELLALPGETQEELMGRILATWDWWMELRASCRELAVSWGTPPSRDMLLLFNQLDAGYLSEPAQRPLAAGRATRLVGWHPAAGLLAKAAGIPCLETGLSETELMTSWALGTEAFWEALGTANNGAVKKETR